MARYKRRESRACRDGNSRLCRRKFQRCTLPLRNSLIRPYSSWSSPTAFLPNETVHSIYKYLLIRAHLFLCFSACVYCSQKRLIHWCRLIAKSSSLVEEHYQSWSFVLKTGKTRNKVPCKRISYIATRPHVREKLLSLIFQP